MTFWSEKSWRKTQILLGRYVSLTWQSTAWRADQMLSFLNLLCFGASCCCLLFVCYALSTNIVEPFEYVFPKCSTCYYKKISKNHQCGFIHAFKHLMLSICSYIESSWMDYLQCGFFHVSSNGLMLNIFCHWEQLNGSSPVWVLSCLFKWLDIEHL